MATTLDFNGVKNWLDSQPENTIGTPYEIIITNAPADGYKSVLSRFVNIIGMVMREGVTSIGSYAFRNCTNLTSINIPEGVTSIGDWVFKGCTNLTSINIPEGVTSIGYEAFNNCKSLTSVTIPSSVTFIGGGAFRNCTGLTSVFMQPSFSETLMKTDSFSNTPENLKLYVPFLKISGWQSVTLSNYGFAAGVKAEIAPTKKWIRIA